MTNTIRLGARLRAARKAAGFKTSKEFLNKHSVPASTYSQHESGARVPDDETLKFYSKVFDINLDWLKKGNGQPFNNISISKKNILSEELLELKKPVTLNQKLLIQIFEELVQDTKISSLKTIIKQAVKIYAKLSTN
jgi:transcriptional regulator with XRE-family HTH domain